MENERLQDLEAQLHVLEETLLEIAVCDRQWGEYGTPSFQGEWFLQDRASAIIDLISEEAGPLTFEEWQDLGIRLGDKYRGDFLGGTIHLLDPEDRPKAIAWAWKETSLGEAWGTSLRPYLQDLRGDGSAGSQLLTDEGKWISRPTKPLRLYRGASEKDAEGRSWTDDLAVAELFTSGPQGRPTGVVNVATVAPVHLLMRLRGRKESEWVVDPVAFVGNSPQQLPLETETR